MSSTCQENLTPPPLSIGAALSGLHSRTHAAEMMALEQDVRALLHAAQQERKGVLDRGRVPAGRRNRHSLTPDRGRSPAGTLGG